eukprot:scaffold8505_cov130-Cylindrotheca_fusiformis.AAC.9
MATKLTFVLDIEFFKNPSYVNSAWILSPKIHGEITMLDVKEKQIQNEKIREKLGSCFTIHQTMRNWSGQKN